jgi:hypothetical protein
VFFDETDENDDVFRFTVPFRGLGVAVGSGVVVGVCALA